MQNIGRYVVAFAMNDGPLGGEVVGDRGIFLLCPSTVPDICQESPLSCVFLHRYPNNIAKIQVSALLSMEFFPLLRSLSQDTWCYDGSVPIVAWLRLTTCMGPEIGARRVQGVDKLDCNRRYSFEGKPTPFLLARKGRLDDIADGIQEGIASGFRKRTRSWWCNEFPPLRDQMERREDAKLHTPY